MVVLCFRHTAGAEGRLRQVAAEVGAKVFPRWPALCPPGAYVSPTRPTVVVVAGERVLAQAVGELPLRELRGLLAAAIRGERLVEEDVGRLPGRPAGGEDAGREPPGGRQALEK
jgi:hypothetical protein